MRLSSVRFVLTLGLACALFVVAPASAQDAGGSAWGDGGLKQELAEVEQSRQELDSLSKQLDEQRAALERKTEEARARQNLITIVVGVVLLALLAAGVAWTIRVRRRRVEGYKDEK